MTATFTCALCGETYEKDWTDEEAEAEKDQLWGDVPLEECEIICDDCFKQVVFVASGSDKSLSIMGIICSE